MTMQLDLNWADPAACPMLPASLMPPSEPASGSAIAVDRLALPASVDSAVWRANEFGQTAATVMSSGWASLDAELPGGGWPRRSVIEVLSTQPCVLEWRLLARTLREVVRVGGQVVVVGPARHPHLPGLLHEGLDERQLVWIRAEAPSERMWVTEQLIKSNSAGAIVTWLPQARQEQLRRLQFAAGACEGPVFLCRPTATRHEASASPLRIHASVGADWELKVNVFKRRGPVHEGEVQLPSVPGGLSTVLTPRLRQPSHLISRGATADALGSASSVAASRRPATVQ